MYNKSFKKLLSYIIEAEEPKKEEEKPEEQQEQQEQPTPEAAPTTTTGASPMTPTPMGGAPAAPTVAKKIITIPTSNAAKNPQILSAPDDKKNDPFEVLKKKFGEGTPIAAKPDVPMTNKEEIKGTIEKVKEKATKPTESATKPTTSTGKPEEAEEEQEEMKFSKRVEKHIKDISGKNEKTGVYQHERKLKKDKRFKGEIGDIERSHKKNIGKTSSKNYFKLLDKKLGY